MEVLKAQESKELLTEARKKVKEIVGHTIIAGAPIDWAYVENNLRNKMGQFLYSKTRRRPMILPVIIEV